MTTNTMGGIQTVAFIKKISAALLIISIILISAVTKTQGGNLWVTPQELNDLPTEGAAWENLLRGTMNATTNPDLANRKDNTEVYTMAKALVYAKTKDVRYANQVRQTLAILVRNHPLSDSFRWDWLGILRSLGSYVIAADLIDLNDFDPAFDQNIWRPWLSGARFAVTDGGRGSVVSAQETRPNNFGTHGGASRIAADLYLNDQNDLDQAIRVFKGYLGNRRAYSNFKYGELSWQADMSNPVGINPKGATIEGKNVDGVLPDDQRRSGSFRWPPPKENYSWEGLQGVITAAEMLHRAGYPAFEWEDRAILRAVQWLYTTTFNDGSNHPAVGDDRWQIWIINKRYETSYSQFVSISPGKMVGWTDWSHQGSNRPPLASFAIEPIRATTSTAVNFKALEAKDFDETNPFYIWHFGDGSSANGKTVSHRYRNPGKYSVILTVRDNHGNTSSRKQGIKVTDQTAMPPIARITASVTSGEAPIRVTYDGSASNDRDGRVIGYSWDFGDGSSGRGKISRHTYHDPGTYTAKLTVRDNDGKTSVARKTIKVTRRPIIPPAARFTTSVSSGEAPLSVTYNGSASRDSDGRIIGYVWDFGDGAMSRGENSASHTYVKSGTYTTKLTVRDNDGKTSVARKVIKVTRREPTPPTARFTTSVTSGDAPLRVTYNASASRDNDGRIIGYLWILVMVLSVAVKKLSAIPM